jgi:hypothetical protein
VSLSPLRQDDGLIVGVFCVGSNAAEHSEREREFRENEARYQMLFDSIDEGFCIIEFLGS